MDLIENKKYTVEEYFSLLEESEIKYEYLDGILYAMSGGTFNHSNMASNLTRHLGNALAGKSCRVLNSDMQVSISKGKHLFPDITVVCGKPEFEDEKMLRLKNPSLIIEVLSPSTREFDRTEKFRLYKSLPSFKEYVLIDSEKINIDGFYKAEKDLWKISNAYKMDDVFPFHSLDIEIPVKDIYDGAIDLI